ncbi:aminotransferase class I/II-fold pyridoxal phosphate-dependent enzyme [Leuconostoc rapi]|uniref:aminotransferase class I/II-fold pyridoxal phosphate-dependent enzyme n=1 Tax=Leuconostoc rapi TaxID=1406906 RepID=UPI001958BD41|nr:aminotransferase class I/II-fold pyridoxal phosphate-dependent enzyme [Leuconostoc rapi]MBM7436516.1 aspartate/methionine/tyrosine aminotransferase [Leuconostoc rapi]
MDFKASNRLVAVGDKYLAVQQEQIKKLQQQGISIINLGRGNPDQPTFPDIVEKAKHELDNPITHGYPPYGGNAELKSVIREFYQNEYGVVLAENEVTVLSGSTAALTAFPMALANVGDFVLTPTPAFFGYHIGITMSGAKSWPMLLSEENNYLPDLHAIPTDVAQKSPLMFLNYPHNPTGAGATRKFFDEVTAFGLKNKIAIVHDFAYADISFDHQAPSFLQSARAKETGVEIYTMSKAFNMAGWRVAFAVGNASIIKLLKTYIQNSVGGTFGAVQNASAYALQGQGEQRQQLRELYLDRRNAVIQALNQIGLSATHSSGTFFIWVKLPNSKTDDKAFAKELLDQAHVAVVPGSAFGDAGQGYIRISLVAPVDVLLNGVTKIGQFLHRQTLV